MNFKIFSIITILLVSIFLTSCATAPDTPSFKTSNTTFDFKQESFTKYIIETKNWLENNRFVLSTNKEKEIDANLPFEVKAKNTHAKKAILLVHGLTDSPGYFKDISKVFTKNGYLVRTILLPGHGSKPGDLINVSINDWEESLKHNIDLLKKEDYDIWLGGFSTGANLVTTYAYDDKSIKGLYLFSPGFYSRSSLISLVPYVNLFINWLDVDEENDIYKYQSMPMNAVYMYYKTTLKVQDKFEKSAFDRPVFLVLSKDDSVINYEKTINVFKSKFTNPDSKFILYTNTTNLDNKFKELETNKKFKLYNSYLPNQRVSNFSHMSVLFSPENEHYGKNGSYLMLNNGQEEKKFISREKSWFSAWGLNIDGIYHARLTWNPHFNELEKDIEKFQLNE